MLGNVELAATTTKSSGFNPTTIIILVVVVLAFYMLLIRPQQRRKQQAQQQQNTVTPGATVRTTAGMYATVVEVDGDDVVLEVAPGVNVRYMRRAVMDVVSAGDVPDADYAPDEGTDSYGDTDYGDSDYGDSDYGDSDPDDNTVVHDAAEPEVDGSPGSQTPYEQATGIKKD